MSTVVAAGFPRAGSPRAIWLEAPSVPQQCAAPLSRWFPSSSISCTGGSNFNLARQHHQFSDKSSYSRSWINDFGLCRVSNSENPRNVSLCCCQGSWEGSGDSSTSNGKVPDERARLRGGDEIRDGGEAENRDGNVRSGDSSEGEAQPPVWDLQAYHKQLQAVAAKVGDPLRDMMSSAGKKLQNYLDSYKILKSKGKKSEQKPEWGWECWQEHFSEVQEQENLVSALKFQLDDAVASEDFLEAARLKSALAAAAAKDMVAEVMMELKKALEEERYREAAKIRDEAAAGLVGWWVGLAEGENDPYGRIIHISPAHGRFVAKGYSARQLSSAAPGIPLFEVFVRKDGCGAYQQQAIYLQRDRVAAGDSPSGASRPIDVNIVDTDTLAEGEEVNKASTALEDVKDKVEDADLIDEGLNRILNFLQDRIPDVKLKVFRVITPNGEEDIPKIVEQLMEEVAGQDIEDESNSKEIDRNSDGELQLEKTVAGESREPSEANQKEMPVRLVVGGVLQSMGSDRPPRVPIRVPSRIECKSRDSFLFHIEETDTQQKTSMPKELSPSWKVATIATQASVDLMPPDVAKVSKEMGEFLQLAVSQVQKRRGLFNHTSFQRIKVAEANADPLNGLYVGAFGPYTSEVVQLRRKYGDWQDDNEVGRKEPLNFFEYVEAVKLTGDLNVPAGQVTFRAKTGMDSRLSHRGIYPEELGVIARYKGQGRLAEPGFQNPQWIEGELVLLDGKGGGRINGAELGFVYSVPERHFLVLFNRLKLQD